MKTWLLTWNVKHWHWIDYKNAVNTTKDGGVISLQWTCHSKHTSIGDRIFLMKLGQSPKGIIASGTIMSDLYYADHWDIEKAKRGVKSPRVMICFDNILDYQNDKILEQSLLKKLYPGQVWSPRASGISIKEQYINYVKNSWNSLIKKNTSNKDINLEEDNILLENVRKTDFSNINVGYIYNPKPKEKKHPDIINNQKVHKRDKQTAINALSRAYFKCEIDSNHPSFKRKNANIDYTEPHHLIPMSYSDKFEVSLDVEANIVSLCSNCHDHLHYGRDIEPLLKKIYEDRKELLIAAGIYISFEILKKMYK